MPEPQTPDPQEPDGVVVAHDLTLAHGTHVALRHATCHVPAGTVCAIIGPNGAGKSTLLDAVAGLLDPVGGTLRVLGASPTSSRRRVAYVPQSIDVPVDLPLTVRDAVAMGRYATRGWLRPLGRRDRDAVERAMERMRIADLAHRHLNELSGGQRHRVLVAQGLAQDHDVLILDEPLAGLDVVSAELIDGIVHDTRNGRDGTVRTVIHTTHDLGEAAAADHVILLGGTATGGRVVAEGHPDDVLHDDLLAVAFGARGLHPPRD